MNGQQITTETVEAWQRAANTQDEERLLSLSSSDIETIGPRGSVRGREALTEWLTRAGLTAHTKRTFAKGGVVVLSQHGVWKNPQTDEITGEADFATRFLVSDGRVVELTRYDGDEALDLAFEDSGLTYEDEI